MKAKPLTNYNESEVLYNFKKYEKPKQGIFNIHTNEYHDELGWIQAKEKCLIIGETDIAYIEYVIKSTHGEWVGDTVIERDLLIPIGIHKTRLLTWGSYQLQMQF